MCNMVMRWKGAAGGIKQRAAFLAWVVWTERNLKVFEDKTTPNTILLARVDRLVLEHDKYSKRIYTRSLPRRRPSSSSWITPPVGVVKLNVDASLATEGWIGMGVVARNHEGRVLVAATRRVRAWWPVEVAEGRALVMALKLARQYGYTDVIMESDCEVLINRLSESCYLLFRL